MIFVAAFLIVSSLVIADRAGSKGNFMHALLATPTFVHVALAAPPAAAEAAPATAAGASGLLVVYCLLILGASWLGGWVPTVIHFGHRRMQMMISVVGGLMLGVGLLHQLPHAAVAAKTGGRGLDWCVVWMLVGVLLTFLLMRWFHFHSHEEPGADDEHECDDPHHAHHSHSHAPHGGAAHSLGARSGWLGIFFGLSVHTLLDGIALAAHVAADGVHAAEHHTGAWLLGIGTFLGVALHKPLDSLSITTLMVARGWSRRAQLLVNAAYSLMCPLGVLLFLFGAHQMADQYHLFVAASMSLAAGVFVCIALSDLLPEIEMHSHDRVLYTILLLVGAMLAWAIGFLEPEHSHDADHHHHDHSHHAH